MFARVVRWEDYHHQHLYPNTSCICKWQLISIVTAVVRNREKRIKGLEIVNIYFFDQSKEVICYSDRESTWQIQTVSCTCHGYRLTNQDDCFLVAFDHSRGERLFEEALVMTRIGSKPNHHNKNLTKLRLSKFLYNTLCLYLKNNIIIFGFKKSHSVLLSCNIFWQSVKTSKKKISK